MPERRRVFGGTLYPVCLAAFACGGELEGGAAEHKPAASQTDSLVLTAGAGAQVWFTLVRPATGISGKRCVERGLEIRSQGKRTKVPLLYTGAAPDLLNDTMMRAVLWKDCRPGDRYLVNLRTGQPVPERGINEP